MAKFASMRPSDDRAVAYKANPDYIPELLAKEKGFTMENLDFNTEYSDFGGAVSGGKLYIASAQNKGRRTYGWNEQPFLDIYELSKDPDGKYQSVLLESNINTRYHEGAVSFSPDGNTIYFSRESFFEKAYERDSITKNRYSVIHLYRSTKLGGKWDTAEGFAINGDSYSVKDPSVSADGRTLYFSSNMPGGEGGFDIYRASIGTDGSLGTAVNLGKGVNTSGDEGFPYISSDGHLYFSSNGHLGLGGLDVFFTKEEDGKMPAVRNIGAPVNSNADDFAFTLDEVTGEGYVSSNRPGGKGSDDVYGIKRLQPICEVALTATLKDERTNGLVSGAVAVLYDAQGGMVASATSGADGKVGFTVPCGTDTEIAVTSPNYLAKRVPVKGTSEKRLDIDIVLEPIEKLIVADKVELAPIYFDFDRSNITEQAAFELDKLVQIMDKYPDMVIMATSHTDSRGSASYNMSLSDRRAKSTAQYVISKGIDKGRITGQGKGESEPKVACGESCTEEEHQLNRRSEFTITSGGPMNQ
jgi:outer membrane protein OmpA-like peptidoglycan-associated protein